MPPVPTSTFCSVMPDRARGADADRRAHLGHRGVQDRPHLGGARGQRLLDDRRVGLELEPALAHRPEVLDDPFGQQLLRVDAAGARGALAVLDLEVVVAEEPMQLAHVADLRPARIGALDAQRVGDHAHHEAPDLVGLGEDRDRVAGALAHLAHAIGAEDDRGVRVDRLRLGEDRPVAAVEGAHDLAAQLEVGGLVLADRHAAGLVDDDVGGLEHG